MRFEQFAAAHGLIITSVDYGKWCRVPTTDHPAKRNGAYKHLGECAHIQNHATMTEPVTWFPDSDNDIKIDHKAIELKRKQAAKDLQEGRKKAQQKANWIVSQAKPDLHAYLSGKGFPDALGMVWQRDEETNLLVIPMRVNGVVVGCQLIDRHGEKKFLYGQRTSGAEFTIGSGVKEFWCEGYVTGLSLHAALQSLKIGHQVHVCFSASNMAAMAKARGNGVVIADNDASGTGERCAKETGLHYVMPPEVGQDFNDLFQQLKLFRASQWLRLRL